MKCLMVRLTDGRVFFTQKTNRPQLLEFASHFKAEIDLVEAENPSLLDLKELAACFCDQNKTQHSIKYKKIQSKTKKYEVFHYTSMAGKPIGNIKSYILTELNNGKVVNLKEITKKFYKISASTIYRCLKHINQDYGLTKVAPGMYKYLGEKELV